MLKTLVDDVSAGWVLSELKYSWPEQRNKIRLRKTTLDACMHTFDKLCASSQRFIFTQTFVITLIHWLCHWLFWTSIRGLFADLIIWFSVTFVIEIGWTYSCCGSVCGDETWALVDILVLTLYLIVSIVRSIFSTLLRELGTSIVRSWRSKFLLLASEVLLLAFLRAIVVISFVSRKRIRYIDLLLLTRSLNVGLKFRCTPLIYGPCWTRFKIPFKVLGESGDISVTLADLHLASRVKHCIVVYFLVVRWDGRHGPRILLLYCIVVVSSSHWTCLLFISSWCVIILASLKRWSGISVNWIVSTRADQSILAFVLAIETVLWFCALNFSGVTLTLFYSLALGIRYTLRSLSVVLIQLLYIHYASICV